MTPEVLAAIGSLIDRYGLPLAILAAFLFLVLSGRFVTGAQLKTMTDLFERERTDRLAAEAIVAKFALANAEMAKSVEGLATTVLAVAPSRKVKRNPADEAGT